MPRVGSAPPPAVVNEHPDWPRPRIEYSDWLMQRIQQRDWLRPGKERSGILNVQAAVVLPLEN